MITLLEIDDDDAPVEPADDGFSGYKTRALGAEQKLRDMEAMGVILPHDYQRLIDRIAELERNHDDRTRQAARVPPGLVGQ